MAMDAHTKPMRIRLWFQERGMHSKAQADQGLAKSWYLVYADVRSIGQLVARITHDYRLLESCPQGLVLEMSGFVLPPAQSTRILQDSDLVRFWEIYQFHALLAFGVCVIEANYCDFTFGNCLSDHLLDCRKFVNFALILLEF